MAEIATGLAEVKKDRHVCGTDLGSMDDVRSLVHAVEGQRLVKRMPCKNLNVNLACSKQRRKCMQ